MLRPAPCGVGVKEDKVELVSFNRFLLGCEKTVWYLSRLLNVIRQRLERAAISRTLGNRG